MKVLSLFSGIGAFEKALNNLGIEYELVNYCEIDKYASKSYAAIHNVDESLNLGDITKVNEKELPKDIDLCTYGFPCQDISNANSNCKGLFNEDGSQTRSGLFFEALRIIKETQPRVAIAENVKNLTSKKFKEQFKIVLDSLEEAGYNNRWCILNAKQFGIPQNRERVFIVSIRKDIDTGLFQFPQGFPLELRLKDMLDDEVDEKYYLSKKMFNYVLDINDKQKGTAWEGRADNDMLNPKIAHTLSVRGAGGCQRAGVSNFVIDGLDSEIKVKDFKEKIINNEPTIKRIDIPQTVKVRKYAIDCNLLCECLRNHKSNSTLSNKEIADALELAQTKVEHWFRQDDCFAIPDADIWMKLKELLKIETDEFDEAIMTFEEKEGVYEKSERHYCADGISPTLTSTSAGNEKILVREATKKGYAEAVEGDSINFEQPNSKTRRGRVGHGVAQTLTTSPKQGAVTEDLRIRKLTPKECFRLMGFDDADFEKAEKVCSNTQLYKQAGNSICVPVVEHLITALFECGAFEKEDENQIKFNDEESFNEIIKECQKGSDNETKEWISFNVRLSTKDTFALCEFLNSKGIEYKAV